MQVSFNNGTTVLHLSDDELSVFCEAMDLRAKMAERNTPTNKYDAKMDDVAKKMHAELDR